MSTSLTVTGFPTLRLFGWHISCTVGLQVESDSLQSTMAPQLEPLARSESKANFYRRLGLSSQKESDNRLYKLMKVRERCIVWLIPCWYRAKEEAVTGRERILSNPDSLIPQLRNNPAVCFKTQTSGLSCASHWQDQIRPPYSNIQIRETSVHQEILRIYRDASPHTKPIYERGHDASGLNEENWIIRWMLCE